MRNWKAPYGAVETVMTADEWRRSYVPYICKKAVYKAVLKMKHRRKLHKNKFVRGVSYVILGASILAVLGCAGNADMEAHNIRVESGYYANGFFFTDDGQYWEAEDKWRYTYNECVNVQFDTKGTKNIEDDTVSEVNEWNLPRFVTGESQYSDAFTVKGISKVNNVVIIESPTGCIYEFKDIEGWSIGDKLTAIMSDNGTQYKQDDAVISAFPIELEVK